MNAIPSSESWVAGWFTDVFFNPEDGGSMFVKTWVDGCLAYFSNLKMEVLFSSETYVARWFLNIFFQLEYWSNKFLRNASKPLPDYTVSYPKVTAVENLRSHVVV
jgi:hypothetical protein